MKHDFDKEPDLKEIIGGLVIVKFLLFASAAMLALTGYGGVTLYHRLWP